MHLGLAKHCYQDQHLPRELGYYKMYLRIIPNEAQIDRRELYGVVRLYKSPKVFKYNLQGIQHVGMIQFPVLNNLVSYDVQFTD